METEEAEDLHDRVELGAAFGELGPDRVTEPVSRDGAVPPPAASARADQADGLAGVVDRGLEQVVGRQQLAVPHEQVADLLAGALVGERPFGGVFAQVNDVLQGLGGFLVQRDCALFIGLAGRQPQPRRAVGVVI
jgi:hypothetical protein